MIEKKREFDDETEQEIYDEGWSDAVIKIETLMVGVELPISFIKEFEKLKVKP